MKYKYDHFGHLEVIKCLGHKNKRLPRVQTATSVSKNTQIYMIEKWVFSKLLLDYPITLKKLQKSAKQESFELES